MASRGVRWIVLLLVASMAWRSDSTPISYQPDSRPLVELGQRLASHSALLEPRGTEPRLPLPSPQDIEAIKKVAQILVMLGEQHSERNQEQVDMLNRIVDTLRTLSPELGRSQKYVIPAIVGDSAPHPPPAAEEIPNDPVEA